MTRALYRPGRHDAPLPDGNALPKAVSEAGRDQRDAIEALLTDPTEFARVHKPLHATPDQYDAMVQERMRTMTITERIDLEIQITQRGRRLHTYDYDPLRY